MHTIKTPFPYKVEKTKLFERRTLQATQTSICCIVVVRRREQRVPSPRHKLGRSRIRRSAHSDFFHYSHTQQRQTSSTHPRQKPEVSLCDSSTSPLPPAVNNKLSSHPPPLLQTKLSLRHSHVVGRDPHSDHPYSNTTSQHPLWFLQDYWTSHPTWNRP